jgi:outer membrane protein assembly factor BamB
MAEPDAMADEPLIAGPNELEEAPTPHSAGELASILDNYMAALQAGRAPDRRLLVHSHPKLATELEACLAGIEFIHQATGPATDLPATLGEFRIIRELGRGGMGVVYKAEQTSLRRVVALKVLRFGVVADQEAMQRFQREAETVARLHHTNIVPIFAVGCERGVHYYAMQYIAGRSLADVLAESQRSGKPLPCDEVAAWGLQAAEALAHAHQRGVIHRDIKPSNLLLDGDGVVWLTDFGLAKRMDEATLTVYGALMGTPRYMSPEQAASLQQPVDRRTDIYSLGATLYELATARPLFGPAEPQLVIAQILTEEPARPRQLRAGVPRDLETVILTCLAKEPLKRYQTAQALVSDLWAVIEGRPIRARRTPVVERIVRYVRQRRKTLTGAGVGAAAMVLLMAGALVGWRYYADWWLGRVELTSDGPPLAAEVLPETGSDQPITDPFDVGARAVITLPAGDYRLRVRGAGLLSQIYKVAFHRGETRAHHLTLSDNRLLGAEDIPFSPVSEALILTAGKADFVEWNGKTLIRRDGSTGKLVWDAARPEKPWPFARDPLAALGRLCRFGDLNRPGTLMRTAPDIDSDGTGDLVWAIHGTPSLLAVSGKDGSVLWTFSADLDNSTQTAVPDGGIRSGQVMGVPAIADIDRDGTADLIAEFAVLDNPIGLVSQPGTPAGTAALPEKILFARRTVCAVSGRSGKPLWKRSIDASPVDLNQETLAHGVDYIFQPKGPFVAVGNATSQMSLDPATGRVTTPALDLGFTPVGPIQYADLDGDGFMEVVALDRSKRPVEEPLIAPTLVAFSMARGDRLWARKIDAWYTPKPAVAVRDWPLATHLDNDGRAEIVVPDLAHNPETLGPYGWPRFRGIRMLDGATGEPRWDCPLWPDTSGFSDGLIHMLTAPDLDADGVLDVVVVSRYSGRRPYDAGVGQLPEPSRIYVDAVSGKGGYRLWHWRTELTNADTTPVGSAFWWGLGSDGWPMLALPIGGKQEAGGDPNYRFFPPDPPVVHLLGAATGIEEHTVPGLTSPKAADLTGDGLTDLWGAVDGKLVAIRADPAEAWRALDGLHATADFDGDGISDLMSNDFEAPPIWPLRSVDRQTALARSGRDGRLLWQTQLDTWEKRVHGSVRTRGYHFMALALPGGDLDGDGVADVVVKKRVAPPPGKTDDTLPLEAFSGRTGKWLWSTAMSPTVGARGLAGRDIEGIDAHACNPGGSPDVLLVYDLWFHPSRLPGPIDRHCRLARISGRDGHVVWDVLLAEYQGGANRPIGFLHEIADLDGNGDYEIVVLLLAKATAGTTSPELRVLSLMDGRTRWAHAFDPNAVASPAFAVGDIDGNGGPDVVVSENPRKSASAATEVTALLGQSGKPLWSWRGGTDRDEPDDVPRLHLGNFDGTGRRDVCISFADAPGRRRVAILDALGRERSDYGVEKGSLPGLWVADLDGDGHDELLFHDGSSLRACRRDFSELWSLPTREAVRELLPGAQGRAATVVINPSLGIDGATGHPMWTLGSARAILKTSDGSNLARALAGPDGTTICRVAMPTSADGRYRAMPGVTARTPTLDDDPRRERRLPWVRPNPIYNDPLIPVAIGATLVNVCVPVMVLWLATRRRFWSMWLLLALPVVVGVSMAGSSTLISLVPNDLQPSPTSWWHFVVLVAWLSMSGLPVVAYTVAFALALVHRQWKKIGVLVAGAVLPAVLILTLSLWAVSQAKPAIEHYNWSGSHQAFFWGAYVAGLLMLVARAARTAGRFVLSLAHARRRGTR